MNTVREHIAFNVIMAVIIMYSICIWLGWIRSTPFLWAASNLCGYLWLFIDGLTCATNESHISLCKSMLFEEKPHNKINVPFFVVVVIFFLHTCLRSRQVHFKFLFLLFSYRFFEGLNLISHRFMSIVIGWMLFWVGGYIRRINGY